MINKKWGDRFGLALYWIISILWIIVGVILVFYYYYTPAGMEVMVECDYQKYPAICFAIGIGTSPLVIANQFIRLFIFGIGMVAIEAGLI